MTTPTDPDLKTRIGVTRRPFARPLRLVTVVVAASALATSCSIEIRTRRVPHGVEVVIAIVDGLAAGHGLPSELSEPPFDRAGDPIDVGEY
ncbi:MAG: hypothetical protein AAF962_13555 [Actinomycetota bacterium]